MCHKPSSSSSSLYSLFRGSFSYKEGNVLAAREVQDDLLSQSIQTCLQNSCEGANKTGIHRKELQVAWIGHRSRRG